MDLKKAVRIGVISGLVMGIALFIGGAVFSRIIYGPQFAPPGKFKPEQLNPWYFIWTKILIGIFFGLLFTFVYQKMPFSKRFKSALQGLKYGFILWLVINLWDISHPLIYGTFDPKNELFWLLYSLVGFLAMGFTLGFLFKKSAGRSAETVENISSV